jgi:hypothetical protein
VPVEEPSTASIAEVASGRHRALNIGNDHKRSVGTQGREVHFLLINRQALKKNGAAGFIAAPSLLTWEVQAGDQNFTVIPE